MQNQPVSPAVPTPFSGIFLKSAGRHFVTMSCVQTLSNGEERVLLFSGFVVEARGEWFYVTAGHILRDVRRAMEGGAKFGVWRFDDQTAGNSFRGAAVPLDFNLDRWLILDDDAIGLDYAVMHLDGLYRQQLAAGGVVAIGRPSWSDHVSDHHQWALLGVPSETVSYENRNFIRARIVVTPLEPADPPPTAGRKAENQFFARLKGDAPSIVKDIDGMSGGPIFALTKVDQEWEYAVIGVQSGWYPSSRVVAACPFSSLGSALEEIVERAREQLKHAERNEHAT
jgi:hypothetical protein